MVPKRSGESGREIQKSKHKNNAKLQIVFYKPSKTTSSPLISQKCTFLTENKRVIRREKASFGDLFLVYHQYG